MTIDPAAVAAVLAYSDEHDLWRAYADAMWRDGWRACLQAQGDRYEAGYADGVAYCKATQKAFYRELAAMHRHLFAAGDDAA